MKINTTTWDDEDTADYASLELTTIPTDEGPLTTYLRIEADNEVHLIDMEPVHLAELKQQIEASLQRYADSAAKEQAA